MSGRSCYIRHKTFILRVRGFKVAVQGKYCWGICAYIEVSGLGASSVGLFWSGMEVTHCPVAHVTQQVTVELAITHGRFKLT